MVSRDRPLPLPSNPTLARLIRSRDAILAHTREDRADYRVAFGMTTDYRINTGTAAPLVSSEMLQVITGKFFDSEHRHVSDEKAVLYSNYRWYLPLETPVGLLEPLDRRGALTTYLFTFRNQLERQKGNFSVVSIGNGEIVEQFRLLCVFGLKAVFAEDRSWAAHLCRSGTTGQAQESTPAEILARYFSARIEGEVDDGPAFAAFVAKVLSAPRNDYKSIVSALRAFSGALDVVGTSLDLAYSMLVYALEALAQKHVPYNPAWTDVDQRTRSALDPILAAIEAEKSLGIQNALLRGANLKNRVRFIEFVRTHVDDEYFISGAVKVKSPLRPAELRRAARNLYDARSAYVHELRPLMHQIRIPQLADGDVFRWDGDEPHLTFNGLTRLFQQVVRRYVANLPTLEKESFDWREDLPGVVRLKMAPQHWIHNAAGFSAARAPDYFRGFIDNLLEAMREGGPVADMSAVMEQIEIVSAKGTRDQRRSMIALYRLYNACLIAELQRSGWREFVQACSSVNSTSVEMMATYVLIGEDLEGTLELCKAGLQRYSDERFHRGKIHLPAIVETAILVAVANKALDEGDVHERHRLLLEAALNCAGMPELQAVLTKASTTTEKLSMALVLPRNISQPSAAGQS